MKCKNCLQTISLSAKNCNNCGVENSFAQVLLDQLFSRKKSELPKKLCDDFSFEEELRIGNPKISRIKSKETDENFLLVTYSNYSFTSNATYEYLKSNGSAIAPHFVNSGRDTESARAWELFKSTDTGYYRTLREYLHASLPSEERALATLALITEFNSIIEPDIKPTQLTLDNLLVIDGKLQLQYCGTLMSGKVTRAANQLIEMGLTDAQAFFPPEFSHKNIVHENSFYFCEGLILLFALTGQVWSLNEISTELSPLLKTLTPNLGDALSQFLIPDPEARLSLNYDWAKEHPQAAQDAFSMGAQLFYLPADIPLTLQDNPNLCIAFEASCEKFIAWLKNTSAAAIGLSVEQDVENGVEPVVAAYRALHLLQPELPLIYRGIPLKEDMFLPQLQHLAQKIIFAKTGADKNELNADRKKIESVLKTDFHYIFSGVH